MPAAKKKTAKTKSKIVAAKKTLVSVQGTYRELQYRATVTGWTPDRVMRAREMADNGAMQELADLTETIFADDRVTGVLSTRTHGLLGLPVEFNGGDEEARHELAGTEDGVPGEWWSMHDESELVKLQAWGLIMGVGLAQRIELPRVMGQPHRYRIETWSPRWLLYSHYAVNGTHWRVQTQAGQVPVVPGDGNWIVYTPYGTRRPWAEGLWRALAFPWLLKHFSLEDRANYSEALGNPIWVGTTSQGSTEKQRERFLRQLQRLGKAGKLVLPAGWDMALKEASGKSYEIYEGQVSWADEAMIIALAGQTVTTEGMSGFSSGNIHDAIKQDLIRFDGERLATALRRQSLEPWALMNYGSPRKAPWPRWETKRPDNVDDQAKALASVGDAITKMTTALAPYGLKPDVEKIVAQFNIPVLNTQQDPASPPPVQASRKHRARK